MIATLSPELDLETDLDLDLDDTSDFRECWDAFKPTERPRLLLWQEKNIVNEHGEPYNHFAYPHFGAPGGPCDAFDDYSVREIDLQMGSRLGKTFFGQSATIYNGTQLRLQQMFASTKEQLATQVVKRTYKMIRQVQSVNSKLIKPERLQNQYLIEFLGCSVFVGWARSAATFADKDCYAIHGNEIDDWQHLTTSKDGDPLDQFIERVKNHWGERKVILESIPKIKGKSRIEARRLKGWNCEYHVPCPHCLRYQLLDFGTQETAYGVKWEYVEGEPQAWYQCIHCNGKIQNHQRAEMMRLGVWVPAGCEVIDEVAAKMDSRHPDYKWEGWLKAPWIRGTPKRNGEVASYRLSSLYALAVNWSAIAKAFLDCHDRPQKLRNIKNQWWALTWEPRASRSEPGELQKRIGTDYPRGVLPEWTDAVIIACDRQKAEGGFVVGVVLAFGGRGQSHVVEYGTFDTLEAMKLAWMSRPWFKPDSGEALYVDVVAIDSGWQPTVTYAFCLENERVIPVKGSGVNHTGETYSWTDLKQSQYETEDLSLLLVNTEVTESDLQQMLDDKNAGNDGALSLCLEASQDDGFIAELSNAVLIDKLDPKGEQRLLWVKRDDGLPNDIRDAVRYGIAAHEAWSDEQAEQNAGNNQVNVESRPDGRGWTE